MASNGSTSTSAASSRPSSNIGADSQRNRVGGQQPPHSMMSSSRVPGTEGQGRRPLQHNVWLQGVGCGHIALLQEFLQQGQSLLVGAEKA